MKDEKLQKGKSCSFSVQTAENKKKLNAEIQQKFGAFKVVFDLLETVL